MMMQNCVSEAFLERVPIYLNHLEVYQDEFISATTLANQLNLGEVLVRKDLAKISYGGKPKIGYIVSDLIIDIKSFMGYDQKSNAIIVGMGQLGKSLYQYPGFLKYNIEITQAFDISSYYKNPEFIKSYCENVKVDVGIITVPKEAAQNICDLFVDAGIKAIWNFSPVRLSVPDEIIVQNINLAESLSILIKHLNDKENQI